MGTVESLWAECWPLVSRLHGRVLDAGCGDGDYLLPLARLPGVTALTAMDLRGLEDSLRPPGRLEARLDEAHSIIVARNGWGAVGFERADVEDMRAFADGEFDSALCWRVLQYVHDPAAALRALARVVVPRGLVCLRVPASPGNGPYGLDAPIRVNNPIPADHPAAVRPDAFTWRQYLAPGEWVSLAAQSGLDLVNATADASLSLVMLLERRA